jgi:transposase
LDIVAYPKLSPSLFSEEHAEQTAQTPMSSEAVARDPITMDILIPRCAGLDVHKKTVVACIRIVGPNGSVHKQSRTFGTMTAELQALADWLAEHQLTHVAMESTGVYWKPVFNLLEGRFTVYLVNAQHIKQVPGRKTDMKDCEWIAQLLQCGLLRPSYIPALVIRQLRDLTRQRSQLVAEQTAVANRIQKVLEDANIKLSAVATDILGASGRAMLAAMIVGQTDPKVMAELARGRLREKIPQLCQALEGRLTDHHRFLLRMHLDQLAALDELIARLNARIGELTAPFEEAIRRLITIPGVERRTAENLIAELGHDLTVFPSAAHLSSWAGVCPGNHQSAGKSTSGRTTRGNRWLRQTLTQAAWAASHTKATYLSSQFRRLAGRRGKKRALVATGHTLLVIIYHVIKDGAVYNELGADYLDNLHPERLTRYLVKRLERLGHRVILESNLDAA